MSFEIWISFVAASLALCFTPGPTVLLVIGQSLAYGKRSVLPTVLGVMSGDLIALTFSLVGIGAILATSAEVFHVMKWTGALYLVYLGIKAWRRPVSEADTDVPTLGNAWQVYKDALMVTALNPKGLVFFMAFLPLFINPQASNVTTQMCILAASFIGASICSVSVYAYFGGRVKAHLSSAKTQARFNKASGGMLIGAGIMTSIIDR
ncbi:LysE family translocator (plasmid) [Vibrio coralliilyticus OCN008]|uniref:LysE family translocator n=1 Tax=Vibrio coralliilyticus TaxID=190893 RepID=UPI0013F498E7|nr:LysE family translocator [Vibrio coralliilyticus]QIJ87726.1 LysE family translocator [Vibrio coralliilyticus OCN008]